VLRRLGCLSALLSILLFVAVIGGIGWFGYQAYVHASESQAVATRTNEVGQAWSDDPAAVAAAASGKPGVRPKGLSSQPFQSIGARPVSSFTTSKSTVTLAASLGTCNSPKLVADVVETPVLVQVLVHPESSWLPDVPRLWKQWRDGSKACPSPTAPVSVPVTLTSPLGRRVLVDAVTGESVAAK
jgi:hypothetical protein